MYNERRDDFFTEYQDSDDDEAAWDDMEELHGIGSQPHGRNLDRAQRQKIMPVVQERFGRECNWRALFKIQSGEGSR